MMRQIALALLHYPVLDRQGQLVTTAITNLDLHDIARSAHTFALECLFIVHPVAAQRELARRVREHWLTGSGARRIPDRSLAMNALRVTATLDDAVAELGGPEGVELWSTSARRGDGDLMSYDEGAALLRSDGPAVLLLFGTGWGLAPEVCQRARRKLVPIESPRSDGYNHLSVRAAAAITFDRLLGI